MAAAIATKHTLRAIYRKLHDTFGPQGWWPGETRVEVIVGAILTQNTTWANVELAIQRMKEANCLSLEGLHTLTVDKLAQLIRPAGTFRVKARRLKAFSDWLHEAYDGDLDEMFAADPKRLREELLGVPGIGPETADAILLYAGDIPTFVVDAYTQRILRRHLLIGHGATYAQTQTMFEEHLPPNTALYGEYHALLVALGKQYCRPRARCDACPLGDLEHDATL